MLTNNQCRKILRVNDELSDDDLEELQRQLRDVANQMFDSIENGDKQ